MKLLTWLSRRRFPYQPLITVNISRRHLIQNLHQFMQIAPNHCVAPVLKSNAYGHGLIEIAKILESEKFRPTKSIGKIQFFVIDSYFEAVSLRASGVKTPLLIIGYTRPETIAKARLSNVTFTISNLETLRQVINFQSTAASYIRSRRISIHLKIDTGMHRQGILPEELEMIAEILEINPTLRITGICSHFSDADNKEPAFTESQIHKWNKIVSELKSKYISIEHIHISNTSGHRYTANTSATMSRLGFGLYGLIEGNSFFPKLDISPVMSLETIITGVKKLKRDQVVGYGNTFKADRDMVIATIPAGYYEGIDRRLSNIGVVGVGDENIPCPIIGQVSMNITIIDVTHLPDITIGTKVTAISASNSDENSIINIAKKCHTIPYEIAVHIPEQLKRVLI